MSQDTTYVPVPYVYKSRGLSARTVPDQAPPESYLDNLNCLEREEHGMSSRFGTFIVNRDPAGTGTSNYFFNRPITSLSRLNYQSSAWRYAGLADGTLWRRAGNAQGAYTQLTLPTTAQGSQIVLSGQPFTSLVDSCFETSQPFNFIYDQAASIKDQGTGNPQLTGIDPSPYTLNVTPYAPLLLMIDDFSPGGSYGGSGVTGPFAWGPIEILDAASGQLITDFSQFYSIGPDGGGATNYTPSATSATASASNGAAGTTVTVDSAAINGLASVVPVSGSAVTLTVNISGSVAGTGTFQGTAKFYYSPDGGTTWNNFYSFTASPSTSATWPPITTTVNIVTPNLSLVQLKSEAIASVYNPEPNGLNVNASINNWYATITSVGAFGPIADGMISLQTYGIATIARTGGTVTLVTSKQSNLVIGDQIVVSGVTDSSFDGTFTLTGVAGTTLTYAQAGTASSSSGIVSLVNPSSNLAAILSATSATLVGGVYTQLLITTLTAHGLSSGALIAVYASSNDAVDGFYQVISSTTYTLTVAFISAVQISATGGYVTGGAVAPKACVLTSQYTKPYPSQMTAWGFYEWVPPPVAPATASFPISAWSGNVAASTTGNIGVGSLTLDLNQNNQVTDDDLIVLTLLTSDPANVAQVELRFYAGATGNDYYTKFIAPAYYQSAVSQSQLAYSATQQQILADTLGLITGQPPNTTSAQLQPSNFSTGKGSWEACYLRRGDFLPVGQAGHAGVDWANITKWELLVTTNSNATGGPASAGGSSFSVNGLYLQWGYGPSSFGGVGYDWRYAYYNANTGTESNGCPIQEFNHDFGYLASTAAPIFLRQAAQLVGQYSNDPQVTHVRAYRRGGTLNSDWVQVIQAPNVTGGGQFVLKDVVADSSIQQAQILVLDNDPPVTSSLVSPIQTTLSQSTTLPGLSSIYSTFAPQSVRVADSGAFFVPNQLVVIGNANDEELVSVISGGYGGFMAIVRLQHNQGEPVNVYAVPRQACNLSAIAYDQVWLAGDPNNPHYLYYSKKGRPENFGPQNYIPVSTPDDPINAVINWRGTLIVGTLKTWKIIVGGAQPYAQPTGSVHGIVAQGGWCEVEGAVWFRAADGLRQFTGADGVYKTLPVEWVYLNNPLCIPPQVDKTQISQDVMAYYNNQVIESYISLNAGQRYRMVWDTNYQRFRYDDVGATAMLWEKDTKILLVGKQIAANQYAVVQDQINDYDDGGWTPNTVLPAPVCTGSAWTTPGNATSLTLYATTPTGPMLANVLTATVGPLAIPLTATVTGISVSCMAASNGAGVGTQLNFGSGATGGSTISTLTVPTLLTWGNSSYQWGTTLTPALVNAGFTAIMTMLPAGGSGGGAVNSLLITVYYTPASHALIQTPINMVIQTPYHDIGKPHNPKQWNEFETDANTQGQDMASTLYFGDGTMTVALSTVNTTTRKKVELFVNNGLGHQSYRASIQHSIQVTTAPIIYQDDIYAAVLAEYSSSYDTYWIKCNTDESKFIKQVYLDYTSTFIIYGSVYADNSTIPYFTFTLPAQTQRTVVRVRFGNVNNGTTAFTMRTWRMVLKTDSDSDDTQFQLWEKPRLEWKPIGAGNSYRVKELEE